MRNSFLNFTIWRVMLSLPLIVGFYLIPYRAGQNFTNILNQFNPDFSGLKLLFLPLANFDGIHYLNIAADGYTNQARFFPFFPLLLKAAGGSIGISIAIVTFIFSLALYFFKKLIALDFSDAVSSKGLIYLLLFPTSFFFAAIYSEGLFLLLAVLAFYCARKKKWLLSVVFAAALMSTRFVGVAILPALLYEFLAEKNERKKLLLFFIAPLGIIAYSVFNYLKWHNFIYFIAAQGELGNNRTINTLVFFPQTIFRYLKILSTVKPSVYEWSVALFEISVFIFVSILLFLAWKRKVRTSYLIFALLNFSIIISTGTFSGLPRYVLTIFPIFMVLPLIKNKIFKYSYFVISPILLFILLMLFSRGYFVA